MTIEDQIIDAGARAGYAKNRLKNRQRARNVSEGWSDQEALAMPESELRKHVKKQARLPVRDARVTARANALKANRRYEKARNQKRSSGKRQ